MTQQQLQQQQLPNDEKDESFVSAMDTWDGNATPKKASLHGEKSGSFLGPY